jgi:hypothetical protein
MPCPARGRDSSDGCPQRSAERWQRQSGRLHPIGRPREKSPITSNETKEPYTNDVNVREASIARADAQLRGRSRSDLSDWTDAHALLTPAALYGAATGSSGERRSQRPNAPEANRKPAQVDLESPLAETRRAGAVVMIAVPVFHLGPSAAVRARRRCGRALTGRYPGRRWQMLFTQHCAVQSSTNRMGPSQKNAVRPNGAPTKNASTARGIWSRDHTRTPECRFTAVFANGRGSRLPQPAEMGPPKPADSRPRDVIVRIGFGVVKPVVRHPRERRA